MKKILSVILIFVVTIGLSVFFGLRVISKVLAHQSGCHRWHSCPSDTGSYICGDLGYYSECGYGSPSSQSYLLPAPQNPANGTWEYKPSGDNSCNQDLVMKWDKPSSGDRFNIGLSKIPGADPGAQPYISELSHTFKNVQSGEWYVNIKTGNKERWSSTSYWTVNIPKVESWLYASIFQRENKQYLQYDSSCIVKFEGPQEFITYLNVNKNPRNGEFALDYQSPMEITIKGWDDSNKDYTQKLTYVPLSQSPIVETNAIGNGEMNSYGLLLVLLGIISGAVILAKRSKA